MKKSAWILALVVFGVVGSALALSNITVWDRHPTKNGIGVGLEDDEVDSSVSGQRWDLEAFFWDGANQILWVVAGFNLANGENVG
ncbi:MAG: hypothetical protein N3D16_10445, partial [Anaerolineales bacterium]|nr:hypothetical protein [Anaerolineales bacterium]